MIPASPFVVSLSNHERLGRIASPCDKPVLSEGHPLTGLS